MRPVVPRGLALDVTPLRTPDFRRSWLGQVIVVVGTQMTLVTVPTQVFQITVGGTAVTSALLWAQALLPGGGSLWLLWLLAGC